MLYIEETVLRLLEQHNGVYVNRNFVEFNVSDNNKFTLASATPNYRNSIENGTIELIRRFQDIKGFVHICSITHVEDLEGINPELLLTWYNNGQANAFCSVHKFIKDFLYFHKENDFTYATDKTKIQHLIPSELETFEDLAMYTRDYFHGRCN